jgi:hypothetical protein
MWTEIPAGTQWYEVGLDEHDLSRMRVFPRAQWRRVADGDFRLEHILAGMRDRKETLDASFLSKVEAIGKRFGDETYPAGTVILVGVDENGPLTALDGNHRLVASLLSEMAPAKLRFLCGLSPLMSECCWYNTNLTNLFRYGRNVLRHVHRNLKAEAQALLGAEEWVGLPGRDHGEIDPQPLTDMNDIRLS